MEQEGAWGTNIEMAVLAHKLDKNIASFNVSCYTLWSHGLLHPSDHFTEDEIKPTIFIYYTGDHFGMLAWVFIITTINIMRRLVGDGSHIR